MIKLLLVDDEPLVLVGLQTMISWEDYGIEICGTARSGTHALEIIKSTHPDIIITDIMMPNSSGLELMGICRTMYGRIPLFIILTCVEDFHHVKQAMRSQAVDYLIKLELTPEILMQSVVKALDILKSLGRTPETGSRNQEIRDQFFMDLLNAKIENAQQLETRSAQLGIDLSYEAYTVCYCQIDSENENDITQHNDLYLYVAKMVLEAINKTIECYIQKLDSYRFAIILCLDNSLSYKQNVGAMLEQAVLLVKNYFNVSLSCCVGVKAVTPFEISDSYNSARIAFAAADRERPIHFYSKKSQVDQVVSQIKDYINQNLDKRLGLNQVANIVGFSPKYISQIFAKHAGCSFIEYINIEKINLAKELLLVNSAKVYEISEQLGFENAFYFSKVFKKHTGLSPRDYMKKF